MKTAFYAGRNTRLLRGNIILQRIVQHFQQQITARLFFIYKKEKTGSIHRISAYLCVGIVFGKFFLILMDEFQSLTLHALIILHIIFQNLLYLIHLKSSYLLSAHPASHSVPDSRTWPESCKASLLCSLLPAASYSWFLQQGYPGFLLPLPGR